AEQLERLGFVLLPAEAQQFDAFLELRILGGGGAADDEGHGRGQEGLGERAGHEDWLLAMQARGVLGRSSSRPAAWKGVPGRARAGTAAAPRALRGWRMLSSARWPSRARRLLPGDIDSIPRPATTTGPPHAGTRRRDSSRRRVRRARAPRAASGPV